MPDSLALSVSGLTADLAPPDPGREAIAAWHRRDEAACVEALLAAIEISPEVSARAEVMARRLVGHLRARPAAGLQALVHEFSLSSEEGVALMCLAEALLRIPDAATRDALIRDKLADRDWRGHAGGGRPALVSAAALGLALGERLSGSGVVWAPVQRLAARLGEPVLRRCLDAAIRALGEQFVTGQTIEAALKRSEARERQGFAYSYDMLGEAAVTAEDAARYLGTYEQALHAIGAARAGAAVRPGLSIKLSALHPRYERARRGQVLGELLPRLVGLAVLARRYDIGLNIDAEEADRLVLSLDLLEGLCGDPALADWDGIGFVVQAYGKRALAVIGWIVALGRRHGRRIAVRLVKGAYWDSEIKHAQVEGMPDYPVFTRKSHTDVSYIACAQAMLAAPDAIFPQFATHNAQTLATIHALAGPDFYPGQYEFQCLHGMGEPLYEAVVGAAVGETRPCRIYAPVGTHESLLAYLVRRLLENGANASFVSRIVDPAVSVDEIVADPVKRLRGKVATPGLALPPALLGARLNSAGLDLRDEGSLVALAGALEEERERRHAAGTPGGAASEVVNPADAGDVVGTVWAATDGQCEAAFAAGSDWAARPVGARAAVLRAAAGLFEQARPALLALMGREAGKTLANGVGEVREAVDFLRYYADEAERVAGDGAVALGTVLCISPWNFPLSIFTGQVAAALAAGNAVIAKPAEETALTAAFAVRLLHRAGVPEGALQFLPGDGGLGARLVADARVGGVVFTGSEAAAASIRRSLAGRMGADGAPVPLIAETGGQNALVVDSSALPEQVVGDVLASAFDSAGQRCSALRILCVQQAMAGRLLPMLRGAMAELAVGKPDRLGIDVGPVIGVAAAEAIRAHVARLAGLGRAVFSVAAPGSPAMAERFVAPTLIEIESLADVPEEVFGPVLHVLRWQADGLDALLEGLAATGYGLTFGLATRIGTTVDHVLARAPAGNVYVNRSQIGAVVGVQPFGGHGRSGTGPKAGGPLYVRRLLARAGDAAGAALLAGSAPEAAVRFCERLETAGDAGAAACRRMLAETPLGREQVLPGPVGERNLYGVQPRGTVLCLAGSVEALVLQVGAALATGNRVQVASGSLPGWLTEELEWIGTAGEAGRFDHVLFDGPAAALAALDRRLAERGGAIVGVQTDLALERLVLERSVSINTAAAGGNAELIMQAEA